MDKEKLDEPAVLSLLLSHRTSEISLLCTINIKFD